MLKYVLKNCIPAHYESLDKDSHKENETWINIKLRKIFYAHKTSKNENKTKDACVEIGKCTENYGYKYFCHRPFLFCVLFFLKRVFFKVNENEFLYGMSVFMNLNFFQDSG